jgi:uncharacterized membrane protein YqjE
MPEDTLLRLKDALRWMQIVTVAAVTTCLILLVVVMIFTMWNTYRLGAQAQAVRDVAVETHDSLCAFKLNLVLTQNPSGLTDARGEVVISRDLLDQGINNRQKTLDALIGLSCEGEVIS